MSLKRLAPTLPLTPEGQVVIDLGDRVVQLVASLGRINTENLKQEVEEVGATAVWWGLLNAEAQRQAGLAKLDEELTEARLNKTVREEAIARGEKPTVDQVAAMIQVHAETQAARLATLNAEANASMIESVKYAVVQKSKTLEALASMITEELRARLVPHSTPSIPRRPLT
jgi:hypothetical protein